MPIYTSEQLAKVGTGETAYSAETGKVYTFSDDKTYMFYGESEDITDVINRIVDERVNEKIQEKENEKGKCLAWASLIGQEGTGLIVNEGYNIARAEKWNDGEHSYWRVYFENELSSDTYVPVISAEVGGYGGEITAVYGKTTQTFLFDVTNYNGQSTEPSQVNIFVWGNQ